MYVCVCVYSQLDFVVELSGNGSKLAVSEICWRALLIVLDSDPAIIADKEILRVADRHTRDIVNVPKYSKNEGNKERERETKPLTFAVRLVWLMRIFPFSRSNVAK